MNDPAITAIEQVISQFFAAVDNRNNQPADLANIRPLFTDRAMIFKHNGDKIEAMNLDEFITPRQILLDDGTIKDFHEWQISHNTLVNGDIATHICQYGKEGLLNDQPYTGIGEKHIQLIRCQGSWKIASVIWQDQTP